MIVLPFGVHCYCSYVLFLFVFFVLCCLAAVSIYRKSMTPPLVASYWPNGPTFAAPKDWSDTVLSEGSKSVSAFCGWHVEESNLVPSSHSLPG
jgi:hypothetical protein